MSRGSDYQPVYHEKPRISANELARFMLAGNTGKLGIIKRAREKGNAAGVRYADAREAIKLALCDPSGEARRLNDAANLFRQKEKDTALSAFMRADAEKSIDVLNALSLMRNQYAGTDFRAAPIRQPKLLISGVQVSVSCDMLIHSFHKGEERIGGALLRLGIPEEDATETAKRKREDMGAYAATLVFMHIQRNLSADRKTSPNLCWSIDVQCRDIHRAPMRNAARVNELEAACTMISVLWGKV